MRLCQIELTNYCNLSCSSCYSNQRKKGFMDFNIFIKAVELCQRMKIEEVWLQNWGESLLHPEVLKFIAHSAKYITTGIITNGSLLNKYIIKQMKNRGLLYIDISINKSMPHELILHNMNMYDIAKSYKLNCYFRSVAFNEDDYKYIDSLVGSNKIHWQRGMIKDKTRIRDFDCPAIDKNFIIYWDGTIVPCCPITNYEFVYEYLSNINKDNYYEKIIKIIDEKINYIHNSLKQNQSDSACMYCFEVDCELPIRYKLGISSPVEIKTIDGQEKNQ